LEEKSMKKLRVYSVDNDTLCPILVGDFADETKAGEFVNRRIRRSKINIETTAFFLVVGGELLYHVSLDRGYTWEPAA
jgi:hypothetical protein